MEKRRESYRSVKRKLHQLLKEVPFKEEKLLEQFENPGVLISPLFSFFCSSDLLVRWHAVTALGVVVSAIAKSQAEQARTVVRRLMWQLNDESGGIGWGCAEAMGEILARCDWLAEEYHRILISYIDPEGNLLEHEPLLEGAMWGTARLCSVRPELCKRAIDISVAYVQKDRPYIRVCAGLMLCFSGESKLVEMAVEETKRDDRIIDFYWQGAIHRCRVSECLKSVGCQKMTSTS
ncbi:DVU0298 family protein [Thermodesulforhabdus norvegica]|uniref:HEAT repeat domain-containing protein n=1 Tax=Thermodesulforhabdus norvegica TaxID=39841 RepID=A0A1I4TTT0_9BACT|nr:DVU0298 family protein [Thermodesulforhabdus norvegica]SFM79963.1 hypothetical protein SAMN05660836_01512 [Thermodesulforhabdus norvegica]